jgi:hypothetical protein
MQYKRCHAVPIAIGTKHVGKGPTHTLRVCLRVTPPLYDVQISDMQT